jgi:hypothetical protein
MFHFQEGRNLCQAKDTLDVFALVRWVLTHPQPPSEFGKEGNIYWVYENGEYTVMVRNHGSVDAALNLSSENPEGFITRLSSSLFNGGTRQSPTLH